MLFCVRVDGSGTLWNPATIRGLKSEAVLVQSSASVRPHRRLPTQLDLYQPSKATPIQCMFLLRNT